jgi:hypothetical protein
MEIVIIRIPKIAQSPQPSRNTFTGQLQFYLVSTRVCLSRLAHHLNASFAPLVGSTKLFKFLEPAWRSIAANRAFPLTESIASISIDALPILVCSPVTSFDIVLIPSPTGRKVLVTARRRLGVSTFVNAIDRRITLGPAESTISKRPLSAAISSARNCWVNLFNSAGSSPSYASLFRTRIQIGSILILL